MDPGTQLGPYEIQEPLGKGGMGEVYRARDSKLERDVAIKLLPEELADDPERLARLKREARSLAALNHAHIATVHGFEERDGVAFIVMELVEGKTLAEKLEKGPLPVGKVLDLSIQMARALEVAHRREIVHRDLKPQNVIVTPAGQVKILDFGIAKPLRTETEEGESRLSTATVEPTRTGVTMGTAPYMSPEQARGEEVDQRTDVWAFGCLLYEMLTGGRAFAAATRSDTLVAVLTREPDWESLPDGTPRALRKLVERCLEKDPDRRLHHLVDLRIELEEMREARSSEPPSPEAASAIPSAGAAPDSTDPTREPSATGGARLPPGSVKVAIGILLLAAALAGGWYLLDVRGTSRVTDRTIAVLPFDEIGGEPGRSAVVDGIHDGVLTELSKISELSVISRTSVMRYADTEVGIPAIADELGVSSVLEGTVQQVGDRVRVSVRLVDGRRDARLWADSYDREFTAENVFAIQGDLAKEIAHQLQANLTPEEERRMEQTPTESLEAYRLYAEGRALLDQRTAEEMRRAVDYFQRAIEWDPGYALAWAGVADALYLLVGYRHADPGSLVPRANEAARRALEIDPDLAEAHASLGILRSLPRVREGPESIRELQRAVELRPSYAEAHNWLSWVHQLLGNPREALESAERAVELNPVSPEAVINLAASQMLSGAWERGLREARRGRELQPGYASGHLWEALALYHLGRFEDARSILRDLSVPWTGSGARATLALVEVASGEPGRARELLAELEAEASDDPFNVGLVRTALGEREAAFEEFQKVDRWEEWPTLCLRYFFPDVLGPLREDPRFGEILREVDRSWGLERERVARGPEDGASSTGGRPVPVAGGKSSACGGPTSSRLATTAAGSTCGGPTTRGT